MWFGGACSALRLRPLGGNECRGCACAFRIVGQLYGAFENNLGFGRVYNREDSDSFTLTAPESVAGIGGRISGEENGAFTLQYNDLQLDDIAPRHTGLTPADAWFCLLNDLRYAAPAQVWSEHTNGESLLVLRYEKADDSVEKQVWLRQSNLQPVYAELYADGARVLTIQVESCQ